MTRQEFEALASRRADEGKLIEAGFFDMCAHAYGPDATTEPLAEPRKLFMAGARHTIGLLMEQCEPVDLERFPAAVLSTVFIVHKEMEEFGEQLVAELKTDGTS